MSGCPVKRLEQQLSALGTPRPEPVRVTITGSVGNIGYALCFMVGQGRLLGPDQPIDLMLLETPHSENAIKAMLLQLQDCTLPLLHSIRGSINLKDGFTDCQIAILVGAKPRGPGMQRKDLLRENAGIFKEQGKALNDYADKNCKVLVVGNPANTNALIASKYAPNIPQKNFTALTRLDENRAQGLLAERLGVQAALIKNMVIWGNHSLTMVPDVDNAIIMGKGTTVPVRTQLCPKWLEENFVTRVQKRGQQVINLRKLSSAASAANAVCDHIRTWFSSEPS